MSFEHCSDFSLEGTVINRVKGNKNKVYNMENQNNNRERQNSHNINFNDGESINNWGSGVQNINKGGDQNLNQGHGTMNVYSGPQHGSNTYNTKTRGNGNSVYNGSQVTHQTPPATPSNGSGSGRKTSRTRPKKKRRSPTPDSDFFSQDEDEVHTSEFESDFSDSTSSSTSHPRARHHPGSQTNFAPHPKQSRHNTRDVPPTMGTGYRDDRPRLSAERRSSRYSQSTTSSTSRYPQAQHPPHPNQYRPDGAPPAIARRSYRDEPRFDDAEENPRERSFSDSRARPYPPHYYSQPPQQYPNTYERQNQARGPYLDGPQPRHQQRMGSVLDNSGSGPRAWQRPVDHDSYPTPPASAPPPGVRAYSSHNPFRSRKLGEEHER
ncbi:hypothetical protein V5O48_004207 [Marasmius crinis-equi]|uniref:Uncharacterized protein n=1 Tax=Marasmius crinis-equi TaxID=585013 RepID=A0ABR3FQQ0_9AGAR